MKQLLILLLLTVLSACSGLPAARPVPSLTPVPPPTASATPTAVPTATRTATPSATATATATAAPSPTPDPLAAWTAEGLRQLPYGTGEISIGAIVNQTAAYTTYRIRYPTADNLTVTGLLHLPAGDGPFPLVIANRGYIEPERYQPGMGSRGFSDAAARAGFVVIAPDFRGYAGGDDGPNEFYHGYAVDVLSLIPLARRLPQVQAGPIAMWGHSRGAAITLQVISLTDAVAAASVVAPPPIDLAADYERRLRQSGGNPGSETWPFPPAADPQAYRRLSPLYRLADAVAVVQLHHGTADTLTDPSASQAIADTLRAAGREAELRWYPGAPHTLAGTDAATMHQRSLELFRSTLNP
jgi:dipeptidyl aminopeptidase/acylaminoacyl peptidase